MTYFGIARQPACRTLICIKCVFVLHCITLDNSSQINFLAQFFFCILPFLSIYLSLSFSFFCSFAKIKYLMVLDGLILLRGIVLMVKPDSYLTLYRR